MVVAVAAERYFAICKPLTLKPKPIFFIRLVTFHSVNIFEFFFCTQILREINADENRIRKSAISFHQKFKNSAKSTFSSYEAYKIVFLQTLASMQY